MNNSAHRDSRKIAYFSMEIALENAIPTYSGGLGVLAGDTIRSAADLRVPMVAVSLLHRKGYFVQRLMEDGSQIVESADWRPHERLRELPVSFSVPLAGQPVALQAWQYDVTGVDGFIVPVYLLDADVPDNSDWEKSLTDHLYGGDDRYRLCQEVILGIGGIRLLRSLGFHNLERFHMNEGHAALLAVELMNEAVARGMSDQNLRLDAARKQCVFTTHTPVPAGHDQFSGSLVREILSDQTDFLALPNLFQPDGGLNMTHLALQTSRYVNGVAKKHGEVSRQMYANYEIDAITNGIHVGTWAAPAMQEVFSRYVPDWRCDPFSLRSMLSAPVDEIWSAHLEAKRTLITRVNLLTGSRLLPDVMTIGFARRATAYKRPDLLFSAPDRLRSIVETKGPVQILYAGKAHPRDEGGIELIRKIFRVGKSLREQIPVIYLENFDMDMAKLLVSGVDLWLNTPRPPLEASGTSGMKAALNGVPSLSIRDGWWIEGHIEGVTGWSVEDEHGMSAHLRDFSQDAEALYRKLEEAVLPAFYGNRGQYLKIMRNCIALNGSFFTTHRMLQEYVLKAYFR